MDEQEEIRITPEPPGYQPPAREQLPAPLPASERRQSSEADRRFIIILGVATIGSIALMMLIALILLIVVK